MAERFISEMSRYEKGELVTIRNVICNRYVGHTGRVIGVKPNKRGTATLDKYAVLFPNLEQAEFWDIQLESANEGITNRNTP